MLGKQIPTSFFIVLVVSFLTGCAATLAADKHMATANYIDPTGRYALVAVDGATIPAVVSHGDAEIKVHSGVFTINADGTCSSKTIFSPPSGGQVTRKVNATYIRNGSNLFMQWQGADVTTGTIADETFTMDNHGMIFVYSRSGRSDDTMKHDQANGCDESTATTAIQKSEAGVFDDFDSALPVGRDRYGIPIGFFTFQDSSNSVVNISTTSDHPQLVGEADNNQVLQLDLDVKAWAGVIHNFEGAAVNTWTPRDWRGFDEFSFWLYGNNTTTSLFVELLDNRNPCSTTGDAEIYTYTFTDNFSGWKLITVPFEKLTRKEIGNGAPNDGLGLAEVHGWAFGTLNTGGLATYYIDNFKLR